MGKNLILSIIIVVLAAVLTELNARTTYATIYNEFGTLSTSSPIKDGRLLADNKSGEPLINLDTMRLAPSQPYRFYARVANRHNTAGHRYRAGADKIANPEWGVVFHYIDELNYHAVVLQCHNSALHDDATDRRTMSVSLVAVENGVPVLLEQATVESGVDLEQELNAVGVEVAGDAATVMVGQHELKPLFTSAVVPPRVASRVGIYTGAGALTSTERAVLRVNSEPAADGAVHYSREELDSRFAASFNPLEGYWAYLDRDLEDKWLKLGGRYTIALVETSGGEYDIVYIAGAKVNPDRWDEGMIKGHLKPTIFTGVYTATWVDAMGEMFVDDVQATIEGASILTVKLPVYRSQLRFSRVIRQP